MPFFYARCCRPGLGLVLGAAALSPALQAQLSPDVQSRVAATVQKVLSETGVPSASVGIVQNGRVVYTQAFGEARLQPALAASAAMAYPIGSISKQFTATAMLLLQQDGKLTLDDPVARYFPQLTRAGEVTIRNLLTHTSGYQDYAPQDYTIPRWRQPVDPLRIVEEFAGKPLDFAPGTQWQYSNTNFVLAALIVQKVSNMPFADFLRTRVLGPAGVTGVLNLNAQQAEIPVTGYFRNALGPLRPAAMEAAGWYFGDADLAMPVGSLSQWDLHFINRQLLSPASFQAMETPFLLKNGTDTHYGLGVFVRTENGELVLEHSGEVGGFVAENIVLPLQGTAISVLTNQEASGAAGEIGRALQALFSSSQPAASPSESAAQAFVPRLQNILEGLGKGSLNRSLFTADASAYFDQTALADFRTSLAPLGALTGVTLQSSALRGGMVFGLYKATFTSGTTLRVTTYLTDDGKVEQLLVVGKD